MSDEQAATAWTAQERADFFAAIARHRRAAWRVTAVCALAAAVLALVVALLTAPLWFALIALAFDAVNLVRPAPNVFGALLGAIETATARNAPPLQPLAAALLAALPGLAAMAVVIAALSRVLRASDLFAGRMLAGRAPDPARLQEQRWSNVIAEMAIAAGVPVPQARIVDAPQTNAAILGRDEGHATIVISARLLAMLDRGSLQGVAAHLVASLAGGDARIGLRVATLLALAGLLGRLSGALADADARRLPLRLARCALRPQGEEAQRLAHELADPFAAGGAAPRAGAKEADWRTWLRLPLAGPLVITGFFAALVAQWLLAPPLAWAWRRRKLMADAAAVRLTRDPDTLARALRRIGAGGGEAALAPAVAHLSVVQGEGPAAPLAPSWLPLFPPLDRRLEALAALGATPVAAAKATRVPALLWLLLAPFAALAALLAATALWLLVLVSIALSALLTVVPAGLLHALLRWLA